MGNNGQKTEIFLYFFFYFKCEQIKTQLSNI